MIVRASRLGMRVGRFSRRLRGVGVPATPDAGLDTMLRIEATCKVPPGVGVLPLLVDGVAVGVFIDCHSVADGLDDTH